MNDLFNILKCIICLAKYIEHRLRKYRIINYIDIKPFHYSPPPAFIIQMSDPQLILSTLRVHRTKPHNILFRYTKETSLNNNMSVMELLSSCYIILQKQNFTCQIFICTPTMVFNI